MTDATKQTMKRYVISSLVTFSAAFGLVILGEIDNITLETLGTGLVTGVLFSAVRAGVKGILEYWLSGKLSTYPQASGSITEENK
jgi:preprotein translocase subunit SecF